MRTILAVLLTLALAPATAQESIQHESQETGTIVIINISEHRTGKLEICDGKETVVKLGQHQWAEVTLPVGEHVLSPKLSSNRRVVLRVSAKSRQFVTLDFGMAAYLPPVTDMQFREATAIEGEHWIKEYGPEKRVEAKKQ